jgi:archaemetzincin
MCAKGRWSPERTHSVQPVRGESFERFAQSDRNQPGKIRNRIYLQPLNLFPDGWASLVERLAEYATAYFGMQTEVLPRLTLRGEQITARTNPYTENRQILTFDVLAVLRKSLPPDAFCVLAVTVQDLYPEPRWNFVLGQASLHGRVGVYSFARCDPAFYGEQRGAEYESILLRRGCKVLAHETAHMFGLRHCIYFRCILNGSNHLRESDSRPLHLCPVCLRKLQYTIGFNFVRRYRRLLKFYRNVGFDSEARWVANRLARILGTEAARIRGNC